ncbi:MAG: hypothetical protein JO015_11545 [Verrucomicrobia bacterium]|nr:hypothetical protein [Verrucomicrobiota bacterium]
MPDPHLRISRRVADAPYGWAASYRALLSPGQVALALRLQLRPWPGVTSAGLDQVRHETERAVAHYFDQRFIVEQESGRQRPVRVQVEFVASDPDLSVAVHAGFGRDNLQHWFVDSGVIVRAHEVGHAFGLKDEYVDPLAANRATTGTAGVFQDHSLMGDFQQEGIALAELKPRHALEIVRGLSVHFGGDFNIMPAGAAGRVARLQTGSEAATKPGPAVAGMQSLRELARGFDAPRPGQGCSGRLRP